MNVEAFEAQVSATVANAVVPPGSDTPVNVEVLGGVTLVAGSKVLCIYFNRKTYVIGTLS